MRSAESKPAVKLQVTEKIFPCWNMIIWTKMKESFGLKVIKKRIILNY
jgi:hypothetical protein